jgi:hypothetical protein
MSPLAVTFRVRHPVLDNAKITDICVVVSEGAPSDTPSFPGIGIKHSSLPSQISYTSSATMKRMPVSPVSPASIIALLTIAFATFAMS